MIGLDVLAFDRTRLDLTLVGVLLAIANDGRQ